MSSILVALVITASGCALEKQTSIVEEQKAEAIVEAKVDAADKPVAKSESVTTVRQQKLASLLKDSEQKNADNKNIQRIISGKVARLEDASGLKYVGIKVNQADIAVYLEQLKAILKDDFVQYRQHQAARDMNSFHLTLLSPNEFQYADQSKIPFGKQVSISLIGLGKVEQQADKEQDAKATYFIVAKSAQAQFHRQTLALKPKDFHVTLGFKPSDIYGVRKGVDTLISQ